MIVSKSKNALKSTTKSESSDRSFLRSSSPSTPPLQRLQKMEKSFDAESNVMDELKIKRPFIGVEDKFLQILHDMNLAVEIFIRKYETEHSVNILDYEIQKESVTGTYFIAGVIRLNFNFHTLGQEFSSSVILKVPQLGVCQDFGRNMFLYDKEKYVYEEVLPLMYETHSRDRVAPICYGSTDLGILVLENLKEIGYFQKEKGSLLTMAESEVVLKSLARFHALSLKHVRSLRAHIDSLTVVDGGLGGFQHRIYPCMVEKLRKYVFPYCSQQTCRAFDAYMDQLDDVLQLSLTPKKDGFNVVVHGDLHYYNLLFKNDQQDNIAQCKFIDFQWSRRGSPILDIMVFLVTSVDADIFEKSCEALLTCYLQELKNTMHDADMEEPCTYGMYELLADFEKYRLCFLYHLICDVPMFWAGHRDLQTVDEENDLDVVLKSAKYISFFNVWIQYLLPSN